MITIIKHFRIENLKDELEREEEKLMKRAKSSKEFDVYDLKNIEAIAVKIAMLMANIEN